MTYFLDRNRYVRRIKVNYSNKSRWQISAFLVNGKYHSDLPLVENAQICLFIYRVFSISGCNNTSIGTNGVWIKFSSLQKFIFLLRLTHSK